MVLAAIMLVPSAPALAQGTPVQEGYVCDQYGVECYPDSSPGSPGNMEQSIEDAVAAMTDDSGENADAVSGILSDEAPDSENSRGDSDRANVGSREGNAGPNPASAESSTEDGSSRGAQDKASGLTRLPDTAGIPPLTLYAGTMLVIAGLIALRVIGRRSR